MSAVKWSKPFTIDASKSTFLTSSKSCLKSLKANGPLQHLLCGNDGHIPQGNDMLPIAIAKRHGLLFEFWTVPPNTNSDKQRLTWERSIEITWAHRSIWQRRAKEAEGKDMGCDLLPPTANMCAIVQRHIETAPPLDVRLVDHTQQTSWLVQWLLKLLPATSVQKTPVYILPVPYVHVRTIPYNTLPVSSIQLFLGGAKLLRGCLLHELYHSSGSPLRPSCNLLMQAAQVFPPENECINSLPPVSVTVTVSWCIQYVSCILITLITSYWKTMKNDRKDLPRIQWRISRSTRPCRRACAILTLNRSSYVSLGRSSAQAHRVRHWDKEIMWN